MKISGQAGTLLLERSDVAGTAAEEDVLINVTVEAGGFGAADQSWIVGADWLRFISELRALESRREGLAILTSASPEDLRLEFFATDHAGHMAARGHVRRRTT